MYIADCLVYRFFASVLLRYYSSLSDRRDRISVRASERDSLAHSHAPLSLSYDHHLFRFFSRLHFSFRMSWFNKRSERNAIPPVKEEQAPSYRSPAPSYKSAPSVRSAAPSNYPTRDGPTYQSNSGYEQSSYQRSIVPSAAPVRSGRDAPRYSFVLKSRSSRRGSSEHIKRDLRCHDVDPSSPTDIKSP